MSTIIKKKEFDLVVENSLKDAGLVTESVDETEQKDVVNESVDNLVDEMKNDTITEGLTNELDTFKRMINYNNY